MEGTNEWAQTINTLIPLVGLLSANPDLSVQTLKQKHGVPLHPGGV